MGHRRRIGWAFLVAGVALIAARTTHADEASILDGRVFQRGAVVPLAGAHLQSSTGASALTDESGRFEFRVGPGTIEILITADGHEPLRVTEEIVAGRDLRVEYRLAPSSHDPYRSVVRGEPLHQGQRIVLSDEALHQAPGALGDPFRVVGLLPGVSMPLPLFPVFVVRGSSPGTNGFFLDGMRVPQLFHLLVGGGVVHPRMIDHLDFYAGGYDASFGHYAGAIIDAETRPARSDGPHGDVEVRLYDVSALGEVALPGGLRIEVGGHLGYPTGVFHALDDRIQDLSFWDYQLRADWHGLTLEAIGSFDSLVVDPYSFAHENPTIPDSPDRFRLTFHRLQIRERVRRGPVEAELALVGGVDEMFGFSGSGVRKLSLGWRGNVRVRLPHLRIYAGVDGEISRFSAEDFGIAVPANMPDELGDLGGARDGVVVGTFVEATADLGRRLSATVGARADVYHSGLVTLIGIDPRISVRLRALANLTLVGSFGLYQQPPTFPVALPGIDTFALSLGLQSAWQGAFTVEAELPQKIRFTATGYYQRFTHLTDVDIDSTPGQCVPPPPRSLGGIPAEILRQVDGQSFGMELFLRREIGRVIGWVSYTLGRSERRLPCGLVPADFDQTHVLNIVTQVRLPWRLLAGAHLAVSTGRPYTMLSDGDPQGAIRNNARFPTYVQVDLRVDREWTFARFAIAAFIEVLNLTYSESIFDNTYPVVDGMKRYDQSMQNGFRWILPSVGLRGKF